MGWLEGVTNLSVLIERGDGGLVTRSIVGLEGVVGGGGGVGGFRPLIVEELREKWRVDVNSSL